LTVAAALGRAAIIRWGRGRAVVVTALSTLATTLAAVLSTRRMPVRRRAEQVRDAEGGRAALEERAQFRGGVVDLCRIDDVVMIHIQRLDDGRGPVMPAGTTRRGRRRATLVIAALRAARRRAVRRGRTILRVIGGRSRPGDAAGAGDRAGAGGARTAGTVMMPPRRRPEQVRDAEGGRAALEQCLEGLRSIGDLAGLDDAVTIGIQRLDHRRQRGRARGRSAAILAGPVAGPLGKCGARGGAQGQREEAGPFTELVLSFHMGFSKEAFASCYRAISHRIVKEISANAGKIVKEV